MTRSNDPVTLFLCGDVMPGRGVDQTLPHPADPRLREAHVRDARYYVETAEAVNGQIPRPVSFSWPWGSALRTLEDVAPDVRVINLESTITRRDTFATGKAVHYRMSPANVPSLTAGRPDVCVLANNHVLDFGHPGLEDTFDALSAAGLRWAGAGRDAAEAARPTVVSVGADRRVVVCAYGTASSGIPSGWAATLDGPGVNFLPELSDTTADSVIDHLGTAVRPGDIAVVSIHWGSNWGYQVPRDHVRFAHRLIDAGVDVVHGHSSHHPRPIEVYRDKLILYGCGDFIDDYEGIRGFEKYRDDLRLLYFATVEPDNGALTHLRMAPVQARRMRLSPAASCDSRWLADVLARISRPLGTRVDLEPEGTLVIRRGGTE